MVPEGTCGGKVGEGKCGGGAWRKHAGNKYRAKNDDGSRQDRRRAGGASAKHRSPVTRGQ